MNPKLYGVLSPYKGKYEKAKRSKNNKKARKLNDEMYSTLFNCFLEERDNSYREEIAGILNCLVGEAEELTWEERR